jgi:hypothetical protein
MSEEPFATKASAKEEAKLGDACVPPVTVATTLEPSQFSEKDINYDSPVSLLIFLYFVT